MSFNVTPLFAVPLYHTNLGSLEKEIKDKIKTLDFERMPSGNGSYTVDKFILDSPEFSKLKSKIENHIQNFLYNTLNVKETIKFEIQNSWINKHELNDYAGSHRHSNSVISGIYYIEVDKSSGHIQFEKDRSYYNLWNDTVSIEFGDDSEKLNFFNAEAWAIIPNNNDLLLFPSHLYHSVAENKSNRERYSLAFNVFPRGTLGGKLNTLRL